MADHPWALVGPWYRTESIGGPPASRTTAPIFQKYSDAKFMDKFVSEPQKSLHFACEDFVERLCIDPNRVVTPELRQKFDDTLKLFHAAHSRFYIVVCELHCVLPGFPSVNREKVCESGFVIRRKVPVVDKNLQKELAIKQRRRDHLKGQLVQVREKYRQKKDQSEWIQNAKKNAKQIVLDKTESFYDRRVVSLEKKLDDSIEELNSFIVAHDIGLKLQGWVTSADDQAIGNWQDVEQKPQTITEKVYPLYPLIPDPSQTDHSANGKTMWFGLVPVGSADVDSKSMPQFDEADLYEVQCLVRRKKDCCEGRGANCCHGEVVWSAPTQSYRLASFFDIDGTSHKPINIKLPDLNALKNQANLGPPGRGVNVKTIAPAESSLNFSTDGMDMPSVNDSELVRSGQQICFFAIFLFFIVALFLFRLFLPIILFLFQLWFLLKLKLCIPPSISLDAGIAVDLKVKGPEIELEFDLAAGAGVEFGGQIFATKEALQSHLAAQIGSELGASGSDFTSDLTAKLADVNNANGLSLDELSDLYISMATDFSDQPENPLLAGNIPLPEDGLVYFEKVAV